MALFEAALSACEAAGATLVRAPLPHLDKMGAGELDVLQFEMRHAMAAYLAEYAAAGPHRSLGDLIAYNRAHPETLALFGYDAASLDPRIPPAIIHGGADHLVLALKDRATLSAMHYSQAQGRLLMRREDWLGVTELAEDVSASPSTVSMVLTPIWVITSRSLRFFSSRSRTSASSLAISWAE